MLTDRDAAALRLGVPVALSLGFAVVLGVPLGFLGAVFAGVFLQFPAALPVRAGVFLVVETALMMCGAWALFAILQPYPVVFLAAIMGAVFWGFWRAVIQKASPLSVIVALMAALLTPFLVLTSPALAWSVALWIPVHIGIGIVLSYAGFSMWPPRPRATHEGASADEAPHTSDRETRDEQARMLARMSMVAMPMVIAFYVFDAGAVLTFIFVAVLAQQLASASAASPQVAKTMLAANALGGITAICAYEILVMAPTLPLLFAVPLLVCTGLAALGSSTSAHAILAGSALTAFVILLGVRLHHLAMRQRSKHTCA